MKRKHADLAIEFFSDDSVEIQYEYSQGEWRDVDYPTFSGSTKYRKKPKTMKYKVILVKDFEGNYCIEIDNYGSTFSWADN